MENLGSSDSSSPQVSQNRTPDLPSRTFKYRTPIGFDFVLSPSHRGFYISKTEDSESSVSLSADSCSESIMSSNTLIISPVVDDALKVQETKQCEFLPKKSSVEEKKSDMQSQQNDSKIQTDDLQTEKTKVDKLKKHVAEPNVVISISNPKIKTTEEELIASKELCMEHVKKWNAVADLDKKLDALTLEKDAVNARIDALRTEKCSQVRLILEEVVNLKKDFQSFTDNSSKLRHEFYTSADVEIEQLKFQVADIFRSKAAELETSEKVIDGLWEKIHEMLERVTNVVLQRDDRITELTQEVLDLNESLNTLMLERNVYSALNDTLQAEKRWWENLVEELETHLYLLQS